MKIMPLRVLRLEVGHIIFFDTCLDKGILNLSNVWKFAFDKDFLRFRSVKKIRDATTRPGSKGIPLSLSLLYQDR